MTKQCNALSRVPLAGFALLAAMLFYVSGAALLVHIELDHGHGPAADSRVVCDNTHSTTHHPTPTDAPKAPTKKRCPLCDMLTGSTHPVAVVAPSQTLFFDDAPVFVLLPAESPAERLSTPDISRRGPPSLG